MPLASIIKDPNNLSEPEDFDPWRFLRLRQGGDGANGKYQFQTPDKQFLHFGHGRMACPGRAFATNEIKLVLTYLLREYDFAFPKQQGRPRNLTMDEYVFPMPGATLLVKKRVGAY